MIWHLLRHGCTVPQVAPTSSGKQPYAITIRLTEAFVALQCFWQNQVVLVQVCSEPSSNATCRGCPIPGCLSEVLEEGPVPEELLRELGLRCGELCRRHLLLAMRMAAFLLMTVVVGGPCSVLCHRQPAAEHGGQGF